MNVLDALHKTVQEYPGGAEALSARLGMGAQVLRNKVNPNTTTNVASIQDVDRIMALTQNYDVLHALGRTHGFVCVPVNTDVATCDMAVLEIVTKVWSASGGVGTVVHSALADGRIEQHEVEQVNKAVFDVHRALEELRARIVGLAEK